MTSISSKSPVAKKRAREARLKGSQKVVPVLKDTGLDVVAAVGGAVVGSVAPGWMSGLGGLGLIVAANATDTPQPNMRSRVLRTAGATMLTALSVSSLSGNAAQRTDGKTPTVIDNAKTFGKQVVEKFRVDKVFKKDKETDTETPSLGYASEPTLANLDALNRQLEAQAADHMNSAGSNNTVDFSSM